MEGQQVSRAEVASDWAWAVEEMRRSYRVFPEDGTSLDANTARFARYLCDQIKRLAQDRANAITGDDDAD